MSKYSKEVKEKAIYLSKKGWGRYRIAKELVVPDGAVRSWLQKFNLSHNLTHKIGKQVFSADFKRKVIETRWKDKLSFKETAELFNLDNPSLIAAWQKRYLDEGILGLQPKPVNVNIRMYNFDDVQCTLIPSVAYGFVTGMNLQLC